MTVDIFRAVISATARMLLDALPQDQRVPALRAAYGALLDLIAIEPRPSGSSSQLPAVREPERR